MSTLVTRSGKGSPLTHNEVDTNFTNLNTDKVEKTAADITGGTINNTTIGATTPSTGVFTTLTAQNEVLKGTGQNLFTYSQDYTTLWGTSNSLITSNATTAPDGSGTASKLIATTANASHLIFKTLFSFVFPFTTSIYAKAAQYNWLAISTDVGGANGFAYFNLQTGVLGTISSGFTASITSAGNGWYRCTVTRNTFTSGSGGMAFYPATADNTVTFVGDNTSGIFIWGAQLEIGSTANTYVPTTTTAVYGTPTLSFSGVASIGLQSDGSLYETSAGTGNVRFYTNNIAQEQMRVAHTASAVNYVQVTGAATTSLPIISAQGSDTNVGVWLTTKGTGSIRFGSNSTANLQFRVIGANAAVNNLAVTGTTAGVAPSLSAEGSDTNISLVLQPKGTGALQAQQTDSTATGGNARGANAVDWQTTRDVAARVASGTASVISGGYAGVASGAYGALGGGFLNSVSGVAAFTGGGSGNGSSGNYAFVGSGVSNSSTKDYSGIVSGQSNTASGYFNFIGGGFTNSGTANSAVTTQSATMNGTTAVTLSGSNANIKVGQLISGTSITFPTTYVAAISGTSLTLSQAASGSSTSTLSFFTPHGVVVGGGNNQATGSYSYIGGGGDAGNTTNRNRASGDWSFVGGGIRNTASGNASIVVGGGFLSGVIYPNTASGNAAVVVGGFENNSTGQSSFIGSGYFNVASGTNSFIGSGQGNTVNNNGAFIGGGYSGITRSILGNHVFPACFTPISSTQGVSQSGLLVLGRQTTDATPTVLCSDASAASTVNQVILPNNSAYYFKGSVIANVTGGGNTKAWAIEGAIKRGANAASTALVGTATVTSAYADAGASTWAITATADTTNGGLAITFTGQASTTIRVVAKLETTEVTF